MSAVMVTDDFWNKDDIKRTADTPPEASCNGKKYLLLNSPDLLFCYANVLLKLTDSCLD